MKRLVVLFVGACILAAAACAHRSHLPSPAPASTQVTQSEAFTFDAHSGTFSVLGSVQRSPTANDSYVYVTQPTVRLNSDAGTLPTRGVRLTKAVLTASVTDDAVLPSHRRVLHSETLKIRAEFTTKGEERTLPELRFVLPKRIETQADYITLDFTDGQFVVPLLLNLKHYWR